VCSTWRGTPQHLIVLVPLPYHRIMRWSKRQEQTKERVVKQEAKECIASARRRALSVRLILNLTCHSMVSNAFQPKKHTHAHTHVCVLMMRCCFVVDVLICPWDYAAALGGHRDLSWLMLMGKVDCRKAIAVMKRQLLSANLLSFDAVSRQDETGDERFLFSLNPCGDSCHEQWRFA